MFELPERTHLVHKAVEPSKLSDKTAKSRGIVDGLPTDLDGWYIEAKYDGVHCIAVITSDQTVHLFSRTGEPILSCDHLKEPLSRCWEDTVLFGELWTPGRDHSTISGNARRHSPATELQYVVFDAMPLPAFVRGNCALTFEERQAARDDIVYDEIDSSIVRVPKTIQLDHPDELPETIKRFVDSPTDAYDGLIAKSRYGLWRAGAGTGGEVIKLKRRVELDLEVVGIEEGKGKHKGRLGAIHCRYKNDKILKVGTGFSDALRQQWFDEPHRIIGQIAEIHGLSDSSKGSIREPRFKGLRFDKEAPDY